MINWLENLLEKTTVLKFDARKIFQKNFFVQGNNKSMCENFDGLRIDQLFQTNSFEIFTIQLKIQNRK